MPTWSRNPTIRCAASVGEVATVARENAVHSSGAHHPYTIFGHDWPADPPEEWRDHHLVEELWAERDPSLFRRQDASPA
ncbi:hypothetical protein ACWEPL_17085 [Nonomuraea sp. NPDC004186]